MDEAPGTEKAADSGSGSAAPLTRMGSAVFLGPDAGGGALLPNDGDQKSFLDFGGAFTFAAAGGVTFAVWVKFESYQNSPWGRILYLSDSGSNFIQLRHSNTTRRANVYIGRAWRSQSFTTPDCNDSDRENDPCYFFPVAGSRWAHVAWTVAADGACSLYRDGATQPGWKTTLPIAANPTSVVYTYAALGRNDWGSKEYFDGALRDARLYDRALSAEQIADLVDSTKRG